MTSKNMQEWCSQPPCCRINPWNDCSLLQNQLHLSFTTDTASCTLVPFPVLDPTQVLALHCDTSDPVLCNLHQQKQKWRTDYFQQSSPPMPMELTNVESRGYPDVVFPGVNMLGYTSEFSSCPCQETTTSGTLLATASFAGLVAKLSDFVQQKAPPSTSCEGTSTCTDVPQKLGFLNPLLYSMAQEEEGSMAQISGGENMCVFAWCSTWGFRFVLAPLHGKGSCCVLTGVVCCVVFCSVVLCDRLCNGLCWVIGVLWGGLLWSSVEWCRVFFGQCGNSIPWMWS